MRTASALLGHALTAANVGFVNLNYAAILAHGRRKTANTHSFAQAVHQEPRRFVADAQHAVNLMRADALLGGGHQEQRGKPLGQRDFGALEYGVYGHGELLTAFRLVALVHAGTVSLALKLGDLLLIGVAAMRANPTIRPNAGFKPITGCGFILEDWVFEKISHWLAPMTEIYKSRLALSRL
jgi:hypothetical protein